MHRFSSPGRLLARAATVSALLVAGTVGTAAVALAHHPEISATTECGGIVHFTATAWQTSSSAARTNPKVGISYSTNGGASFVSVPQLASYNFGPDNDYTFSDSLNLPSLTGSLPATVVIKATALEKWGNGGSAGSSRQTGVLTLKGCPAKPSASISEVSCSAGGTVTIKLNNDGDDAVEFTVSGPDGSSTHTVAGHGTKSLTKAVAEDADATYSVAAAGMTTLTKTVHRDCIQPDATVVFADKDCTIEVTFGNAQGSQEAVFAATNAAGNSTQITVPAGGKTSRSHVVTPGTTETLSVTSAGMATATHALSCQAVEVPTTTGGSPNGGTTGGSTDNDSDQSNEEPVNAPVKTVEQPVSPAKPESSVLGTSTSVSKPAAPRLPTPAAATVNAQRELPFTGSDTAELLTAGLLALAFGTALTAAGRRRGDVH